MKTKTKIVLSILIGLVILCVIAALIVGTHLGDIVKVAMETVGPKLTQTTLTVDKVNVSLLSGSAGVNGLVLGNPDGYKAPQAITVGSAAISLEPSSVLGGKVVIHSIELKSPEITFEGNPFGDNNLTKIMANVNGSAKAVDQTATNSPAATPAEKKAGKKLEVDDFLITGAKVHASLTGLISRDVTLPLPDIHLTDLGKGPEGITAADLTQKVLSEITIETVKALGTYATNLGKGVVNSAQGLLKGATSDSNVVGGSVDKLKKGLGNLFGH